ncbi:MAG: ABC transporter ATP-binding protein [Pyrobaculum arsenaticum]|uniref:ABC transporter related protein n=2 Tax=Pyrobaculum arsenaticum TaxID=121277 RepID=A4WI13_PYRAR|nr:ABC transporter ATP-binding protein [Pyrobaculum arsenaticum]ABP50030.1 ABC transporter related protein [Pyrobaculum arsenaticum DSM 13514]MCY0890202.1 ABC transporter ATP-binding protein [Pyrobaculum arsenaticum]NYR15001.1 ABC transporter ATP-binding protein [Pyrobaculum arsenaticum]
MESKIVFVEGVWKRFGNVVANEDVSIYVDAGEVVSLLGPNGAGKTTLVRQIYGELRPDKGRVAVIGMRPKKAKERGYVSVVPQEATPFNMLKVTEHVEMLVRLRGLPKGEAKRCAEEAIDAVGLRDYRNKLVYDLSGGMKRLVLVASAIACRPKLIILDEPTVGIDAHNRRRIWEAIRGAKDGGSAVVLTTHYIHEAEELSDRVYMINRRIIMEGTPGELRRKLPWVEIRGDSLEKPIRAKWDDAVKALHELVARKARFEVREPSLEDLFLELFGVSQ